MKLAVVAMGPNAIPTGTYTAGGSITGSAGESCTLTFATPSGGVAASAQVHLSGTNAIARGAKLNFTPSTMGSGYTSAPTIATLSNGTATCSGTATVTTSISPLPVMSAATNVSATTMKLALPATNAVSGGKATVSTDDTAAIQAAIAQACTQNGSAFLPAGYYGVTGLTIPCATHLYGVNVTSTAANGGEVTNVSPYVVGSVLWMMKPNTDAIRTAVTAQAVNFDSFGIVFDPTMAFLQTGHGINGFAADPNWGIENATWHDLFVWGHDGNHYAFTLTNSVLWNAANLYSYGGGGLQLHSTVNAFCCSGNADIGAIYVSLFAGGSASGVSITSAGTWTENLIDFYGRLQVNQNDPTVVFPGWPIPTPYLKGPGEPQLVYIPSNIPTVTINTTDIEPLMDDTEGAVTLPYNFSFRMLNATPGSTPTYIPAIGSAPIVTNLVGDTLFASYNPPSFTTFDGDIVAVGGINSTTGFSGRGIVMGNQWNDGIGMVNSGGTLYFGHLTDKTATIMGTWDQSTKDLTVNGNVTAQGGSNIVYSCKTAGALPVGALTINAENCGASSDTGLRVK